jgi:hypothetical protein
MGPPGCFPERPTDDRGFVNPGKFQGRPVGFRENTFWRKNPDELVGLVKDRMYLPFIFARCRLRFFVFGIVDKIFHQAAASCNGDVPDRFDYGDMPAPGPEKDVLRPVYDLVEIRYRATTFPGRADVFMADRADNFLFVIANHCDSGSIGIKDDVRVRIDEEKARLDRIENISEKIITGVKRNIDLIPLA